MFHGDFQELSQRSDNFSGVYDFDRIALKRWSLPTHHPSRDLWLMGHLDVRYLARNALSEMYRHFLNPRGSSSKLTCQDSRRAEKPSSCTSVPRSLKQSIRGFPTFQQIDLDPLRHGFPSSFSFTAALRSEMLELAANVAFHRILYCKDVVSKSAVWNVDIGMAVFFDHD